MEGLLCIDNKNLSSNEESFSENIIMVGLHKVTIYDVVIPLKELF